MQEGDRVSLLVCVMSLVFCSHAPNGEVKKIPGTASIRIVRVISAASPIGTHHSCESLHGERAGGREDLL